MLMIDQARDSGIDLSILLKDEYNIFQTENRIEAMEILSSKGQDIDVIILAVSGNQKNELKVLKAIKEDEIISRIPVIAMLENRDIKVEASILEAGADDIIVKPFSSLTMKRIDNSIITSEKRRSLTKAEEERYHIIVELSGTLVLEWNFKEHQFYSSPGFKDLVMGHLDSWSILENRGNVKAVHPDDILTLKKEFFGKIKAGKLAKALVRLKKIDGSYTWCELSATCVKGDDGKVEKVIATINIVDADITVRQKLKDRSEVDVLTGVYNKDAFYQKTREMLMENPGRKYIIVCADIERFRMINDLFGMDEGDRLLKFVGQQLKLRIPREFGTVGRLSVDVFAMCFPDIDDQADIIVSEFREQLKSYQLEFDINIALGFYKIEDRKIPINFMCDRAIMALKTVKGNYLKHYAFYDETLRNEMLEEQNILNDMETALKNRQFEVYFQPVYSLSTGKIISAEALVRWAHPEKGMLSPGAFLPIFEHNGFITKLDTYVWETVCRRIQLWKEEGKEVYPISVNVSRVHLYDSNFCSELLALIKKYDVEPHLLKLEITESAYTENEKQLLFIMNQLQCSGFKILMDDFGSGYSSLNMLKDVPVDVLKIDMRFINGFEESTRAGSILASVVQMARRLKLPVIAEGVETREQAEYLRLIGCESAQGYFFSRPIPPEDFELLLAENKTFEWFVESFEGIYKNINVEDLSVNDPKATILFQSIIGGIGIYEVIDQKTIKFVRGNDEFFELLGISRDNIEKEEVILENVNESDQKKIIHKCKCAYETGKKQEIIYTRKYANGEERQIYLRMRCIGGDDKRAVFYFILNDISDLILN